MSATIANTEEKISITAPPSSIVPQEFCERFQNDIYNIEFYEMIEGTKMNASYHNGFWRLHSDDIIDNEGNVLCIKAFDDACRELNVDLDRDLDKHLSYSFVFQTPYHKYVSSFLYAYEIYLVGVYSVNNNNVVSCNLKDVTTYKSLGEQPCYKNNRTILIPDVAAVNFKDLELIVKEWGVGNGLPIEISDNDDYDRTSFIHPSREKGIAMYHVPSGTTTEVLNRHYLKFISKQNQQNMSS